MTADTCPEKDDQIAVLAKILRMVGHTSLCERAQYLGRSCICDLETMLADLPAAARELAEERERLRELVEAYQRADMKLARQVHNDAALEMNEADLEASCEID